MDFNLKRKLSTILGIRIDSKLNWKAHIDDIALELIRAKAILYKVRDFVNAGILKVIYHALFESHIHYACLIWGQSVCRINHLFIRQNKTSRLTHFKERYTHTDSLHLESKMVKFPDEIKIENCLFISKYLNNKLPPVLDSWFIFSSTSQNYETLFAIKVHLKIPTDTATIYSKGAFINMTTKTRNNIQSQIKDPMINIFSPNKLKIFLFGFYWNLHQT